MEFSREISRSFLTCSPSLSPLCLSTLPCALHWLKECSLKPVPKSSQIPCSLGLFLLKNLSQCIIIISICLLSTFQSQFLLGRSCVLISICSAPCSWRELKMFAKNKKVRLYGNKISQSLRKGFLIDHLEMAKMYWVLTVHQALTEVLHELSLLFSRQHQRAGAALSSSCDRWGTEVKKHFQGHTTGKWWSWNLKQGLCSNF